MSRRVMGLAFFKPDETINVIEEDYNFKPLSCDIHIPDEDEKFPFPRSGHRIVCDDANLYSYGGYNPTQDGNSDNASVDENPTCLFPEVWKYNFAQMKWKKLPVRDVPSALASPSVILSGKLLIVYGGTGVPFHMTTSNRTYVCNLDCKSPKFQLIECSGKFPERLYGQAVFMRDTYLYVVGGTTGFDYYIDIHRLNLITKEWEEVYICKGARNDPVGRYRHELALVDDKIYVIGGGTGIEAFNFEQIVVFDISQNMWETLITTRDRIHGYPSPRQYHSLVRVPNSNSFIMLGGTFEETVFDDAWRLDIPSLQWTLICSLRLCTPVYFHTSTVTPSGKMYTFGGVSHTSTYSQERVSHVQSAWICIPKLQDICWEVAVSNGLLDDFEDDNNIRLTPEYSKRLLI